MGSTEQLLGELSEAKDKLQTDVEKLYGGNSRRKQEINDLGTALIEESSQRKLEFEKVLHAVEESNQIAIGVVEKVDKLTDNVGELTTQVEKLEEIVGDIVHNQFDWSKFMRGCISPRGMILISVIGFFLTTMFLSVFAPETLPDFFDTVPKGAS